MSSRDEKKYIIIFSIFSFDTKKMYICNQRKEKNHHYIFINEEFKRKRD